MNVEAHLPCHNFGSRGSRSKPEKGRSLSAGHANSAANIDAPVLNLDAAGRPLRYSSALKGPHAAEWRRMDGEISRLIDSETL